jgi:hypothetical protein
MRIDSLVGPMKQMRALRQESVPRVNGAGLDEFRNAEDGRRVEIALRRLGGSDAHGPVGKL